MHNLPAYKYLLEERKISENTIRDFHLGYIDTRGMAYVDADFTGDISKLIDFRFYNSTFFPIQNLYGEVVGVSSRPLVQNEKTTKYVNTSYEKAEHLYGLCQSWTYCIQERVAYVCEGNLDVLQMWEKGIKNVVGMLGSNFSVVQLGVLLGFVEKIIFVPDGDMAGLNFMEKTKTTLLKRYKDVPCSFAFKMLPTGFDPDNYLKRYSKEEFLALPEVNV